MSEPRNPRSRSRVPLRHRHLRLTGNLLLAFFFSLLDLFAFREYEAARWHVHAGRAF